MGSDGLNGMNVRAARKFVNELLGKYTKGFFKDTYWQPIHKTWTLLAEHKIDAIPTSNRYLTDEKGTPTSKRWEFIIEFTNDKGKDVTLHGVMVASGAGSVSDPLDRYDVVAYVS
jgi:hypothetical protein